MDTRKTCCRKTLYASTEDWVVHVQGNHGDDVLKAFLAADAEDEAQKGQASSGNLEAGDQAGDKLDAVRAAAAMEVAHKATDDLKDNVHKAASDDEAKDAAKAAGDHAAKEAAAKAIHDAAKGKAASKDAPKDTGGDAARRKAKGKADADKGKRAATTEDKGTYGGAEAGKKAKTASLFTPARIEKLAKMEERQKKKEEEKDAEESGEEEADPEEEEDDQVLLYQFGIVHSDPNDDFSDCKLELTPSSTASDAADKDEDGGEEVNNIFYHPDGTPSP